MKPFGLQTTLGALILVLTCLLAPSAGAQGSTGSNTPKTNTPKTNTPTSTAPTTTATKATKPTGTQTDKPGVETAGQEVDGIVAIANKEVITQRELDARIAQTKADLKRQKIALPPDDLLAAQLLQRLITEKVLNQEARRFKLVITDENVQQTLELIAERNKVTIAQMRKQIESGGVTWDEYLATLKKEVMMDRLRQRVADSNIIISDAEVDNFLREQNARQSGGLAALGGRAPSPTASGAPEAPAVDDGQPLVFALAQILVRVPEGASPEQVASLRKRAEDILNRLKGGASFESLAAGMSDGAESMRGGQLGARPVQGWPDLFVNAVKNLKDGQVSGIVQSGNGFHILKMLARSDVGAGAAKSAKNTAPPPPPAPNPNQPNGPPVIGAKQGPMLVQQTKARHILIKTSPVVTDEMAQQRMKEIQARVIEGKEPFSDLAKRFSNDSSAPQGGDLGWLNPGETVPPFDRAMNELKIGEVSQPVKTQFGWHLIVVDDRRTQDMAEQFQRNQVRQFLFQKRSEAAFEEWIAQVRNQSYVDNRLEKRLKQATE